MKKFLQIASNNFDSYFNSKVIRKIELLLLRAAVFSFILHLLLLFRIPYQSLLVSSLRSLH